MTEIATGLPTAAEMRPASAAQLYEVCREVEEALHRQGLRFWREAPDDADGFAADADGMRSEEDLLSSYGGAMLDLAEWGEGELLDQVAQQEGQFVVDLTAEALTAAEENGNSPWKSGWLAYYPGEPEIDMEATLMVEVSDAPKAEDSTAGRSVRTRTFTVTAASPAKASSLVSDSVSRANGDAAFGEADARSVVAGVKSASDEHHRRGKDTDPGAEISEADVAYLSRLIRAALAAPGA